MINHVINCYCAYPYHNFTDSLAEITATQK